MRQQRYALQQGAQAVQPSSNVPHQYSLWLLSLLSLGALFYEIVVWVSSSDYLYGVAFVVYLGVLITILALDWRHILTLHGHIDWSTLSWPGRIGITVMYVVLTVLLFSLPVLYLAVAMKDTLDERRRRPDMRKLKTAQLEAELGILPGVEGECPACHRPLQAGAEYCAYCGASISHKPRVCPRCASTAMPDAQFCPNCGAPLSPPSVAPGP